MKRLPSPRRSPGPHSGERGQSLTEAAIFITLLMVVLAGLIDLGRMYYTYLSLKDAAAEGAAYGSMEPTDLLEIEARRGSGVRVEVTITYEFITPFIGAIAGSQTIPLSAEVVNTILAPGC